MTRNPRFHRCLRIPVLLASFGMPYSTGALPSFFDAWQAEYPLSPSSQAECQLCHANAGGNTPWNAYGIEVVEAYYALGRSSIVEAMRIVEAFDSDSDCSTTGEEIAAGTQPGWRHGNANRFYHRDASSGVLEVTLQSGGNAPAAEVAALDLESGGECGCQPVRVTGGRTLMLCL